MLADREVHMAISAELTFRDTTLRQSDETLPMADLESGGQGPAGPVVHRLTETDDGIRIPDVWDSRDEFDRFWEAMGAVTLSTRTGAGVRLLPSYTTT